MHKSVQIDPSYSIDADFVGNTTARTGRVSVDQGAHLAGYITSITLQNGAYIAYRI